MKVHSYTIIHYGKDYISYALRSVYDYVDQLNVIYTPHPSHGHKANIPPIETREELIGATFSYNPSNKIVWFDSENIYQEGQQRDTALEVCKRQGANVVVVVDCDEVWESKILTLALSDVIEEKNGKARSNLVNMTHFWRSFNWVCKDDGWPVRIVDLRRSNQDTFYIPRGYGNVFHFGYAVTNKVMRYKWQIHGHKGELRPNWFSDKWDVWPPPKDCHPTNTNNFWQPEPFVKENLPQFMRNHPFYNLDKIE